MLTGPISSGRRTVTVPTSRRIVTGSGCESKPIAIGPIYKGNSMRIVRGSSSRSKRRQARS